MKSVKVCEYSRSMSFHYDLILQDQASGERSQDQWSSGFLKMRLTDLVMIIYCYGIDLQIYQCEKLMPKISHRTIIDWYEFCRDSGSKALIDEPKMLKGWCEWQHNRN